MVKSSKSIKFLTINIHEIEFKIQFHDASAWKISPNWGYFARFGVNSLDFRPKSSKLRIFLTMHCHEIHYFLINLAQNRPKRPIFSLKLHIFDDICSKFNIFLKIHYFCSKLRILSSFHVQNTLNPIFAEIWEFWLKSPKFSPKWAKFV